MLTNEASNELRRIRALVTEKLAMIYTTEERFGNNYCGYRTTELGRDANRNFKEKKILKI